MAASGTPQIITFDYADVPTMWEMRQNDVSRIKLAMGPVGSGKSSACMIGEAYDRSTKAWVCNDGKIRTRWGFIRNTHSELKKTTINTFLDWLPEHQFGRYNKSEHNYVINKVWIHMRHPDGTVTEHQMIMDVHFIAMDHAGAAGKLKSFEATGMYLNELSEIPKAVLTVASQRVGRYPSKKMGGCRWRGVIADTNPPDKEHWIVDMFDSPNRPKKVAFYKQPPALLCKYDARAGKFTNFKINPAAENVSNIDGGAQYWLDMAETTNDQEAIKVSCLNEYGLLIDGKPVYGEYRDPVHYDENITGPMKGVPILVGWDNGLTPAIAMAQVTPRGKLVVFDEIVSDDSSLENFGKNVVKPYLRTMYPGFRFVHVVDPAMKARQQGDAKTMWAIVTAATGFELNAGREGIKIRTESLKYPMNRMVDGGPGFAVGPLAKTIHKALLGAYYYKKVKDKHERFEAEPCKNRWSHVMNALEYLATWAYGDVVRTGEDDENPPLIQPDPDEWLDD